MGRKGDAGRNDLHTGIEIDERETICTAILTIYLAKKASVK